MIQLDYVGHVGSLGAVPKKISILGVGVPVLQVRELIAKELGIQELTCDRIKDPNYERTIRNALVRMLTEAVSKAVGSAITCNKSPLDIAVDFTASSIAGGGVAYDKFAWDLAQKGICAIIEKGVSASRLVDPAVNQIVVALRESCGVSGSSATADRGGMPVVNNTPAPTQQAASSAAAAAAAPSSLTPSSSTPSSSSSKSSVMPLVVIGGVALAVSAVILFRKR